MTSPTPDAAEKRSRPSARLVFLGAAVFAAVLDLWSKSAAFAWVRSSPEGRVVLWPGRLEFLERYNDAGIWSVGYGASGSNMLFSVVSCLVVPLVIGWAF